MRPRPSRHARALPCLLAPFAVACSKPPPPLPPPPPPVPVAQRVFEAVAPSVVAVLNDLSAEREQEIKDAEKTLEDEPHAPKHVIDVTIKKGPLPDGSGFVIEGNRIVTAAHVVSRPDKLQVTTRSGQTVACKLVRLDAIRDVAILEPLEPLVGVPPLPVSDHNPGVGEPVWALGHTGAGRWALSWGMSGGTASGVVDLYDAKLLLFDAPIYPGFSGGPVVTFDAEGHARVVGVNHAILFTGTAGFFAPIGGISSAVSADDLREVAAGNPHPLQAVLSDYAKQQRGKVWADLFITDTLSVSRDANDQQVAFIAGNAKTLPASTADARIPCAAMLFGLPKGEQEVDFEVHDPNDATVASEAKFVTVDGKQRVAFASTSMHFPAKVHGKYSVVARREGKEVGRAYVSLDLADDDDDLVDEHDGDSVDDGQPDVDVVVAQFAREEPLMLGGIRAGWAEKSYPRHVDYRWFARGTRGWSGTNVTVGAYVLDEGGGIIGRSDGCFMPEVRPEHGWTCVGSGSGAQPLPTKVGSYDIVFTVNDRPVAWWPMEAAIQKDTSPGSAMDRFMKELKRTSIRRHPPKAPAFAPAPPAPKGKKPPH